MRHDEITRRDIEIIVAMVESEQTMNKQRAMVCCMAGIIRRRFGDKLANQLATATEMHSLIVSSEAFAAIDETANVDAAGTYLG